MSNENKKSCIGASNLSESQKYFELRNDIEKSIHTLEKLGGTGMFIDEFKPAIYRLRGIITGMDITMRSFDL